MRFICESLPSGTVESGVKLCLFATWRSLHRITVAEILRHMAEWNMASKPDDKRSGVSLTATKAKAKAKAKAKPSGIRIFRANPITGKSKETAVRATKVSSPHAIGGQLFATLGQSNADDVSVVEVGLPVSVIEYTAEKTGLEVTTLTQVLQISERTLARRKVEGQLTTPESDRVLRLHRLLKRTESVIGDGAKDWLNRPNRALDGRVPFELSETETGAAAVLDVLGRIEHGVFS